MYGRRFFKGFTRMLSSPEGPTETTLNAAANNAHERFLWRLVDFPVLRLVDTHSSGRILRERAKTAQQKVQHTTTHHTAASKHDRHRTAVGGQWRGAHPSLGGLALQCLPRAPRRMYATLRPN